MCSHQFIRLVSTLTVQFFVSSVNFHITQTSSEPLTVEIAILEKNLK